MREPKGWRRYVGVYVMFFLFMCSVCYGVYLQFVPTNDTIWNFHFNIINALIYLLSGILGFLYLKNKATIPTHMQKALRFLIVAQVSWGVAAIIEQIISSIRSILVPTLAVSDIFYVIYMICIGVACWFFIERSYNRLHSHETMDVLLIVFIANIVMYFIFNQVSLGGEKSFTRILFDYFYVFIDVFALSLTYLVFRISEGNGLKMSLGIIAFGVLLQVCGDFLWIYQGIRGFVSLGHLSNMFFSASGFMVSLGMLQTIDEAVVYKNKQTTL